MSEPIPDWLIPPDGGFTAEEFLRMRGLPPHTQLIDGSLIFVSPQRKWHSSVVGFLWAELDAQAPGGHRADREMAVRLDRHQVPEPDVLVVTEEAFEREAPDTHYLPADLLLAVEAVSPDSVDRDRDTKPYKYARAGIPHFWRVENEGGRTVVYTYQLDPATGGYGLTGIHHGRLKADAPFPVVIDLDAVRAKRG
ncbi:Uma2 family endonuclease [Nocardiopsis potens]|uniref:Uma2 family endonuclease n=1 Tax=Nocardiopsis potens TaxID=1246458 RepID=UPI0004784C95|nr:Uma2 family endonuclease [Nocardiopsis potens]